VKEIEKVILVSGGSKGLGEGIVRYLLKNSSHKVITFSRKETPFVKNVKKKYRDRFLYLKADISSSKDLEEIMEVVQKRYQRLDVLINNAGVAGEGVLPMFPDEEIHRILDINLKSTISLTRLATRLMIKQKEGNIINISSILGLRGYAGLTVYSASKAGLIGFTKSLARELGRRSIRVNAIAPGYFETEMSDTLNQRQKEQMIRRTPLGRLGTTEDIVPLIDFLIADTSRFITGHVFVVDGGVSC